jgi:hypothetical protein
MVLSGAPCPVRDVNTVDVEQLGHRLRAGLNGDADQRAATDLLTNAGHGVWLVKLSGWPQYLQDFDDQRVRDGLWVDWAALLEDLVADERAAGEFRAWSQSSAGRQAGGDEVDVTYTKMVPRRPWHGASGSELVLLRIAPELAAACSATVCPAWMTPTRPRC